VFLNRPDFNCAAQNLSLTCQPIMFACHIFAQDFIFQYRRLGQIVPAFRYFRNASAAIAFAAAVSNA